MRHCRYSVHDLSRVQLSGPVPRTPRFNMPFELGVAVTWTALNPKLHEWFLFEEQPHRLQRSLSDVSGTDPYIHPPAAVGHLTPMSPVPNVTGHLLISVRVIQRRRIDSGFALAHWECP